MSENRRSVEVIALELLMRSADRAVREGEYYFPLSDPVSSVLYPALFRRHFVINTPDRIYSTNGKYWFVYR